MIRSPENIAARSLEFHAHAVAKIRQDPALFNKVRENNERLRTTVAPNARPYVQQWQLLIDEGIDACLSKAVEDSESGRAMRAASPFSGILTDDERLEILARWSGMPLGQAKRQVSEALFRLEESEARFAQARRGDNHILDE